MGEGARISLVRSKFSVTDALDVVNSIAGIGSARIERKIYYPYFRFSAECSAQTLIGRKPLSIGCLVDACSGLGATTDAFDVDEIGVPGESIMAPRVDAVRARKSAQRFVTHNLGRGLKTVGHFGVALESRGLVHKAFWLVRCEGVTVMVDGVTGALHMLGKRAA